MNKLLQRCAPAFILVLLISFSVTAQQNPVDYSDVAVIVNTNSDSSVLIADYFIAKRNIPSINRIPVHTSVEEEISDSMFNDYALQIKTYLDTNNMSMYINYLVTTKGCPLKVSRHSFDTLNCNSSAESELMLLRPDYNDETGSCLPTNQIGWPPSFFINPYYGEEENFSSTTYGIYLVTRLDGYSVRNVFNLIDSSGPNTYANPDSVLFVFDQSPNWGGIYPNPNLAQANQIVSGRGWNSLLSTDSVYVTNQKNVIGYMSWGSNDGFSHHYTQYAKPNNTWANGSIAETCVSTSGRSFQPGTAYGQSLIADLLQEGATGAKGYVYEPFTVAIADPAILFNRYTKLSSGGVPKYNLAESYFSASMMIGWMDVVIGDPKTSITSNIDVSTGSQLPEHNVSFKLYPNPASGSVYLNVSMQYAMPLKISITDLTGRKLWSETVAGVTQLSKEINLENLSSGVYLLLIQTDKEVLSQKIIIAK